MGKNPLVKLTPTTEKDKASQNAMIRISELFQDRIR